MNPITDQSLNKCRIAFGDRELDPNRSFTEQCIQIRECYEYCLKKEHQAKIDDKWIADGTQGKNYLGKVRASSDICLLAQRYSDNGNSLGKHLTELFLGAALVVQGKIQEDTPRMNSNDNFNVNVCRMTILNQEPRNPQYTEAVERIRAVWEYAYDNCTDNPQQQTGELHWICRQLMQAAQLYKTNQTIDPDYVAGLIEALLKQLSREEVKDVIT